MTPRQFIRLDLNERARTVVRHGRFLTSISYYNYQCDLYAIEEFFVEIKLTAITSHVESIHLVESYDLEKYINQIELPVL